MQKKRGVKLAYPFDEMEVGSELIGGIHIVGCAINWAKRQDNGWLFKSHRIGNNQVKLTRIK